MKEIVSCKALCKIDYDDSQLNEFAEKIEEDYRINWIVDNLPAATKYFMEVPVTETSSAEDPTLNGFEIHYEKGFPLGFVGSPEVSERNYFLFSSLPPSLDLMVFLLSYLCLVSWHHPRCEIPQQPRALEFVLSRGCHGI